MPKARPARQGDLDRNGEGRMKLDLAVGQSASRSMSVTEESVRLYAELSGDRNPLHFDPEFAARTSFGKLVAQGGITTGVLHALVAEDMPGPGTVFLSQSWKFTAPVFIGDTITGRAEVLGVHDSKPVCQLRMTVVRGDGETVLEGEAWCYRFVPAEWRLP
jgi:acyl dehydratase